MLADFWYEIPAEEMQLIHSFKNGIGIISV